MVQIGDRVRALRQQSGLTQEGLARVANVTTGTIIRLELGYHAPSMRTLRKVAAALEVRPSDLLDDDVA